MNLLIIGSDSFIAQKLLNYPDIGSIKGIARMPTRFANETTIDDFRNIDISNFAGIDVVLNFAAIVHRPDVKNEKIFDDINYKLAVLNAQKAKQVGVKLFIQMSTIAVYGDMSEISINTPYNPETLYGTSKLKADKELLSMQDNNFKVAIIRPPMVYGGGKAPGNMMRLIKLADKGIPLPFKGFDNKRDFINVNNLVQYLAIIAENRLFGIHLISDQESVSTEYLLNIICKYLGNKALLFKIPEIGLKILNKIRPNDFDKLFGTLRIATNFPHEDLIKRYSVEDGIREMVEWFKNDKVL